jgi:5'-nucleotidase
MRAATGAEVALTNKGGLRADLPAGPIRLRELYQVSPFGNTCVTMRLTGRALREELEYALGRPELGLEVSGLEVRYDEERAPGDRLIAARVAGEPIATERRYIVVTNAFLAAGGDGHAALAAGEEKVDTGIEVLKIHAEDVRRRGRVALALGPRVWPAEATMPAR